MWTVNFQMFKLVYKRQRLQRSNCQHPLDHRKSKRVPEKHLLLLYWLSQSLWLCGSQQLQKILKEMGIPDHLTCLLRNLYAGQEATVRNGKNRLVPNRKRSTPRLYSHPAYLTYMQSISCEMPGWMKHKLESKIAARNINNLRYTNDTTLKAESEKELKTLLMKVKEESKKS